MLFGSYFLRAVANLLDAVIGIYIFVLIVRALISWVNPDPFNPIVRMLHQLTEPVLRPVRRIIPPIGGLDLSVLVLILLLYFLKDAVVRYLYAISGTIVR